MFFRFRKKVLFPSSGPTVTHDLLTHGTNATKKSLSWAMNYRGNLYWSTCYPKVPVVIKPFQE